MAAFFTVNGRGVAGAIGGLTRARAGMRLEMRRTMGVVVHHVERSLKRNALTGQKGSHPLFGVTGAAGDTLGVRSGRTRNSIVARVLDTPGGVVGVVGSPERHARLHEHGGTVTGAPYLRIPTREMQTGAGVDRMAGRSARSIAGAFLLKSKAGNLWIAMRGRGRELVLLYLLKRQVTFRPRRMFQRTLERSRAFIRQEFRNAVARVARAS